MSEQTVKDQNSTDVDESHQNDGTDTKATDTPDQITVAFDAVSLGSDIPPPIFKLINDCWEEIFDWLSLEELHSFGRTCKHFQRLTGEYFKWKYQNVICHVNDNEKIIQCKKLDGFIPFTQKLAFFRLNPDASFRYVLKNIKSPKSMEIVNARSTNLDLKLMKNNLSNVEVLKFRNSYLDGSFIETFLKLCVRLKRLTIGPNAGNTWLLHKYPTLQYFKLTDYECDSLVNDELMTFFQQNPNVRSFATTEKILFQNRDSFIANNIELDELTILRVDDIDELCVVVNDLYRRGFYKRLHLKTVSTKCLKNMPGLVTLYINTYYNYVEMPQLDGVMELFLNALSDGLHFVVNMEEVSMNLKNLERIFTPATSEEYLRVFFRNSAKLKEIKIEYLCDGIDVVAMNIERKKLKGAKQVTIFLDEEDYLAIKSKHNKTDFGLIEVKRKESYEGVWDHAFG
ncbi:uncharacterized protein LOC116349727 [Contarinia nasturtii]|uniref:uncharacterized protein LOC116349727 n=1 Tax=Contarinia nasturtii TaxID=265458 RepID=UPI0012D409CE|nr:uncharacterized protein LOC116349727 [Contarinia nasturtii]XP_031637155.1 uncharacterized protein LOC116349727 [Contarinia nasturtii]XP_031637156.1 uncharacterized protein LOC116349727 [Contarinia nasturtii]